MFLNKPPTMAARWITWVGLYFSNMTRVWDKSLITWNVHTYAHVRNVRTYNMYVLYVSTHTYVYYMRA